jgi:hypothetical protein
MLTMRWSTTWMLASMIAAAAALTAWTPNLAAFFFVLQLIFVALCLLSGIVEAWRALKQKRPKKD